MKIKYQDQTFRAETWAIIVKANEIIAEYDEMGYQLTVRQLYYQFVSRDILPNTDKSYDKLSCTISDARLAGLVDWDAIKDRTRHSRSLSHWTSPSEIVEVAVRQYARDKWEGQPYYVEVWVEKDALIDVIEQASQGLDVTCFSCRGYVSQSAMWEASKRFIREGKHNKKCVLFHLGDHDPSGIDMTRDIGDRLTLFRANVDVRRIALTMDQIRQYNPPPNPAKTSDVRCAGYVREYGDESWELDALDPPVLAGLIQTNVTPLIVQATKNRVLDQEAKERNALEEAAESLNERFSAAEDEDEDPELVE